MSRIWKELNVSPEEQKLAEEIINSGAGENARSGSIEPVSCKKRMEYGN